jgi:carboxypeptidase T
MRQYRVTIGANSYDALADLVRKYKVIVATHTVQQKRRGYSVRAHATDRQIRQLRSAGYTVRQHEDTQEHGKARQKEFRAAKQRRTVATGRAAMSLRAGGGYLSVDEVEEALAVVSAPPNDSFTELIALPRKTWGGRTCQALKIGKGNGAPRPGIYFLGGVHARVGKS